jgi:putative intracellular protease/amidase
MLRQDPLQGQPRPPAIKLALAQACWDTDLTNAGAEWVDEEVVVDKTIVTSRKPAARRSRDAHPGTAGTDAA